MKVFRWLLCHLLSITLLVSCVLIFLSRDALKEDLNRLTGRVSQPLANGSVSAIPEPDKSVSHTQTKQQSDSNPDQVENKKKQVKVIASSAANRDTEESAFSQPEETVGVENGVRENSTDILQAEEKSEPQNEPQKKSNDPWDTVLDSVNDTNLAASEFGRDIQEAIPEKPSLAEASFPPEDYDPESSNSAASDPVASENLELAVASDVFSAVAPGSISVTQDPENAQQIIQNSRVEGYESVQDIDVDDQFSGNREYYSALENARRLHWEGNTVAAQAAFDKLMFEYPSMPEAPADLGNLLLQQGNREGAVWAYQNAIPRYLNLHREQEAINLTRFVSQYDPAIAESLQKKYW